MDKLLAARYYSELADRYPEVTMDEKMQYEIALSLHDAGERESSLNAYRNFVLNYPFSKLADDSLLAIGKIFMEKGEYKKAGYAFMQIVLFYPYSDVYEEAKYHVDRKLPELRLAGATGNP